MIGWIGNTIFKRYFLRLATRTKSKLDDTILNNIRTPIFVLALLFGVYYGLSGVSFLQEYSLLFTSIFSIIEILVIAFTITRIANVLIGWYGEASIKRGKNVSNHLLTILKKLFKFWFFR